MQTLSDSQKKIKTQHDNNSQKIETFWTLCPYCYYMYEYDGLYKECSLRCQNCKKAFHGVQVTPPPVGMVVEGKEQYYCGIGCFPLKYDLGGCLSDKKCERSGSGGGNDSSLSAKEGKNENFVVISDDSDDDDCGRSSRNGSGNGNNSKDRGGKNCDSGIDSQMVKNVSVGSEGSLVEGSVRTEVEIDEVKVNKRVKSVARNTKKLMGRGKKVMKEELSGNQGTGVDMSSDEFCEEDGDAQLESAGINGSKEVLNEDELEFYVGEDDIYVGYKTAA